MTVLFVFAAVVARLAMEAGAGPALQEACVAGGASSAVCGAEPTGHLALLQRGHRGRRAARDAGRDGGGSAGPFDGRKVCHQVAPGTPVSQCLPDLMLIGNSKCGSTSIAAYLLSNPQIIMQTADHGRYGREVSRATREEGAKVVEWESHVFDTHGLSDDDVMEENWATAPFVPTSEVGDHLQLHYRPNYFYYPDVPFRIADLYSNARSIKYVAILREPVAHAVSSWKFHIWDTRSFAEVVDQGIAQRQALELCESQALAGLASSVRGRALHAEDLPPEPQRQIMNSCFWGRPDTHDTSTPADSFMGLMGAHVDKGVYVSALRRWFSVLGRESFFVFSLEEWTADAVGIYRSLADFAGFEAVGPHGFASVSELQEVLSHTYNDGPLVEGVPERPEPSEEDKARLAEFYRPYNEELFELLGRRLW